LHRRISSLSCRRCIDSLFYLRICSAHSRPREWERVGNCLYRTGEVVAKALSLLLLFLLLALVVWRVLAAVVVSWWWCLTRSSSKFSAFV
jgi:hypothetical protein